VVGTHENKLLIDKKSLHGSNLNLKTLFEIVEKGFGGKVKIAIDI